MRIILCNDTFLPTAHKRTVSSISTSC